VLRFWETKFPAIKPLKRGGGRRYYRPEDVELLRRIRQLLYNEGYTIKGVQRLLKDGKPQDSTGPDASDRDDDVVETATVASDEPAPRALELDEDSRRELDEVLGELRKLREMLARVH
jgi:DNA-binding transcriptional MerR regulator